MGLRGLREPPAAHRRLPGVRAGASRPTTRASGSSTSRSWRRLEADNFWFRARNDLIVWALQTYFPDCPVVPRDRLRDRLRAARDPRRRIRRSSCRAARSSAPVSRSRRRACRRPQFSQMDARRDPVPRGVRRRSAPSTSSSTSRRTTTVLAEVAKALRPGGGFMATVPQHPALWSLQDEHAHHVRRYTARGLRRKVEAAGFEVVRMTSFVSLLLPLLVAARLRPRGRRERRGLRRDGRASPAPRHQRRIWRPS